MLLHIKQLYLYRELLTVWTSREIKVRYKQTFLGAAWAILQPFAIMVMFSLVFSYFMHIPSEGIPYPIFSYTAVLPWTFFSTSLTFGIPSLINNMNLVTKIYFPREVLPLASIGAAFIDFSVASIVFLGMIFWYKIPLSSTVLWYPIIIFVQVIITLGVVLPLSALIVFYRDIRFIVPVLIQLWLYATPVIYPIGIVPEQLRYWYGLNPMVGVIDSYRKIFLYAQSPDPILLSRSIIIGIILFVIGYLYFKRVEFKFADII